MDLIKKARNLTFDVKYDDETRKHVEEGILFEFQQEKITMHLGTNRAECLFSIAECLAETVEALGLEKEFHKYLNDKEAELDEQEGLTC